MSCKSLMKDIIKHILKKLPIAITKNQIYDLLTIRIMKRSLHYNSNCIDVGVLDGEILDKFLQYAPGGNHFGFEPIPEKYENLRRKYENLSNVSVYQTALGNKHGKTEFNYVLTNPAYSGIKKRKYDNPEEKDSCIKVDIHPLDDYFLELPEIDMIKVDVEGAEYLVFDGAQKLLRRDNPLIVFEHGKGAADIYGIGPVMMYAMLSNLGYNVFLLKDWLKNKPALCEKDFVNHFNENKEYYFVAAAK